MRALGLLILASLLLAGCQLAPMVGLEDSSAECARNSDVEMCEQALAAVRAELGEQALGGRIRIDDVQCAHGNCWTWAYFTPAAGGAEWTLSVDWLPNGQVTIGYVTE